MTITHEDYMCGWPGTYKSRNQVSRPTTCFCVLPLGHEVPHSDGEYWMHESRIYTWKETE